MIKQKVGHVVCLPTDARTLFCLPKVPGVFISRLVRGGLAESTGLLGVNDEILEVNGIDVAGKSLDQVNKENKPPKPLV